MENPMSDYLVEPRPTLKRWLAGERVGPLPMRGADQEPPELSFERSSSFLRARKLSNSNYGRAYGGWHHSPRVSSPSRTEREGRPMHVLMRLWRDLFRKPISRPPLT
jgi:hypothetical protein